MSINNYLLAKLEDSIVKIPEDCCSHESRRVYNAKIQKCYLSYESWYQFSNLPIDKLANVNLNAEEIEIFRRIKPDISIKACKECGSIWQALIVNPEIEGLFKLVREIPKLKGLILIKAIMHMFILCHSHMKIDKNIYIGMLEILDVDSRILNLI